MRAIETPWQSARRWAARYVEDTRKKCMDEAAGQEQDDDNEDVELADEAFLEMEDHVVNHLRAAAAKQGEGIKEDVHAIVAKFVEVGMPAAKATVSVAQWLEVAVLGTS